MGSGGGGTALAILLIGIVLIAFLFGSQIIGFVSAIPQMINDLIAQIMGTLPGSGVGDISGYTWIGYTVYFTDGTSKDIRQERPTFSLFPYSISFEEKEISSLRVDVKAQFVEGEIDSWVSNTSLRVELYKKPEGSPKTSSTGSYMQSGQSWVLNSVKTIGSFTVQAQTLDDIIELYGDGDYLLQSLGSVSITIVSGGASATLDTVAPAGGVDITYSSGVPTGLSVTGGAFSLVG